MAHRQAQEQCPFVICIVWAFIHYFVTKLNLMPNSDVSEIPIVASYILYILLYVEVIKMYFKKEDGLSTAKRPYNTYISRYRAHL